MLRSMYAGISGMKGSQTKLDVIGNNIANVNTSGYKKGRVTFQDMMSQTISGAEGPLGDNARGGINPKQVGLGTQIGSIDNIQTQGNRQTTDRTLDLALEGDGMFVLGENLEFNNNGEVEIDPDNDPSTKLSYSRSGNFYLDEEGYIVNPDGKYLLGDADIYDQDEDPDGTLDGIGRIRVPEDAESFSIQSDGTVSYVDNSGDVNEAGQIRLANFSNPGGLEKQGSNTFQWTENAGENVTELADLREPGQDGAATIVSGALEMSNVDLAEEFTEMITSQRGFQANTKIITTSDEILQELVNLKR
ncbi:flagellar basal body rod protein FlgG [Aquibacillus sediminis]|uniref:flagellar basal body rod protein FlgG n=1 Tax=Aquibacillus sediminis TaxID=2574734 RepID=UPI00110A005B|nr:flagellar basal body rod protein FlgG [Aquibacillus sediminis]